MDKLLLIARLGLPVSAAGVAILLCAGLGTRLGVWHYRTGFLLMRIALAVGAAGVLLSVVSILAAGGAGRVLFASGLLLGLVAAGFPLAWYLTAKKVPLINDITTDTAEPPYFEAVVEARKAASAQIAYGGDAVAEKQRSAYPDVAPLSLPDKPPAAFDKALAAARESGWLIVASDRERGRIEATATTRWFGFKDDIVVRIAASAQGSRIDVRSASRVGRSDIGANAKRILAYLALVNTAR